MKRLFAPGLFLPLLLAVAGVALIVVGQLQVDGPRESLPPIDASQVAVASPSAPPSQGATAVPTPSPTPIPDDWAAVQIEIPSVDLNVAVRHQEEIGCGHLDDDAVYVVCGSTQPGRSSNSYIAGHALQHVFKRLWNVMLGAEVRILMSDGVVLRYVVTEVHPNVSCPDSRSDPMPNPPLALQYARAGCPGAAWLNATDHERLTLQTSQGYNRNWGELVIVAEPVS